MKDDLELVGSVDAIEEKFDLPDAETARAMSWKAKPQMEKDKQDKEWKTVVDTIKKAITSGKTSCHVLSQLDDVNIKKLDELGYKFAVGTLQISW